MYENWTMMINAKVHTAQEGSRPVSQERRLLWLTEEPGRMGGRAAKCSAVFLGVCSVTPTHPSSPGKQVRHTQPQRAPLNIHQLLFLHCLKAPGTLQRTRNQLWGLPTAHTALETPSFLLPLLLSVQDTLASLLLRAIPSTRNTLSQS